jgi:hypothetical protein
VTQIETPAVDSPRVALTSREQAVGVLFALWMVVGLFLDGWAHDNNKPETFFTPWHGVLYSGFVAAAAAALAVAWRSQRPGAAWWSSLPRGHGLTLGALVLFALGAFGDLVWHEAFGFEVALEALLSPTHLVLLVSGLVALSAPLRAAWMASDASPRSLREFAPTVLSLALLVALVGFFLLYLSPFVNDAAGARFDRVAAAPHDHPSTEVGELQQILGVASILVTTVLLVVPIHLVLRRWRPPPGTFALLVGVVVALFVGLDEFSQAGLLPAGLIAGAAADVVVRRGWTALAGVAATVAMWLAYFGLYQLTVGTVAWSAELWAGTVTLAGLVAAAIALLTARLPVGNDGQGAEPLAPRTSLVADRAVAARMAR